MTAARLLAPAALLLLLPLCGADCNTTCIGQQRQFLQTFYTGLGGSRWLSANTSKWTLAPAANVSALPPEHCSWMGVFCCNATGNVSLPTRNIGLLASDPLVLPCPLPYGIFALYLGSQKLSGTLPSVWAPLADTLTFLFLSGAFQPTLLL